MYEREKVLGLPVCASAQLSNLSRLFTGDQVYLSVIHKQEVLVVCATNPGPTPIRVRPQLGPRPFIVSQAAWVCIGSGRHVLVVTGGSGVLIYDWDGAILLKAINLLDPSTPPDTPVITTRGITGVSGGNIAVGCSTGEVVILSGGDGYSVARREHAAFLHEENDDDFCEDDHVGMELDRFQWRSHGVVALASHEDILVVGDIQGNITVAERRGSMSFIKTWEIESYGSAVTCLVACGGLLAAGFISGHVRIYDLHTQRIQTEICAHARAVTGLDFVAGDGGGGRVASVSEDSFARVWDLRKKDNQPLEVSHLHSRSEKHQLLTGVAFTDQQANGYVTTAYDVAEVLFFITT